MKKLVFILVVFVALIGATRCSHDEPADTLSIRLRWVKAYPKENWTAVKTGLYWSLSYLGAQLPKANESALIERQDSSVFTLHLESAGFSQKAKTALETILAELKKSEEYQKNKCIDLARFLVLTEHSSKHYYAITGVAESLNAFRELHSNWRAERFWLNHSCVAKEERLIEIAVGTRWNEIAFIANEGHADAASLFEPQAYEAFDVMENGQLRFAVYGKNGQLIDGSPHTIGDAGKPSKCIWCHELSVQPLFFESQDKPDYLTAAEFGRWVDSAQHIIERHRATLHPLVQFANKQDHTYGELLYISFMEPSAMRLSSEWGIDSVQAKKKMGGLKTHVYEEFKFLGSCYYRYYADSLAPFKSSRVPFSVREVYGREPNYLNSSK